MLIKLLPHQQLQPVFKNNPKYQKVAHTLPIRTGVFIVCKLYTFIIAGYCLIPFAYLGLHKWWAIYGKFYYIGHIVILPMSIVWKPLIEKIVLLAFPLDKPVEAEKKPLTDQDGNQHDKTN